MRNWLRCDISVGQFRSENGVDGLQFNGEPFSFFTPNESVEFEEAPTKKASVPGWVAVDVLEVNNDLALLCLPRSTFQSGPYVTVKLDQLRERPRTRAKGRK